MIGAGECFDRIELEIMQTIFLRARRIVLANMQAIGWRREVRGDMHLHTTGIQFHHCGGVDGIVHTLDADPGAGKTRQRESV